MKITSKFIIIEHKANKAGLHKDVRFKMPTGNKWISFTTRKEIPLKMGKKIMLIRTTDHSEKEALFVGTIEKGYGAGTLKKWDAGACNILKWKPNKHIVIEFVGGKIKGIYHFLSSDVMGRRGKEYKGKGYLFFKAKVESSKDSKEI